MEIETKLEKLWQGSEQKSTIVRPELGPDRSRGHEKRRASRPIDERKDWRPHKDEGEELEEHPSDMEPQVKGIR